MTSENVGSMAAPDRGVDSDAFGRSATRRDIVKFDIKHHEELGHQGFLSALSMLSEHR